MRRDLLQRLYPHCLTLRQYVLANLPQSSKIRRRKIQLLGQDENCSELEKQLCQLLDASLVCYRRLEERAAESRWEQWLSFSQKADDSNVTLSGGSSEFSQSEVCILRCSWCKTMLNWSGCRLCHLAALLQRPAWCNWSKTCSLRWISQAVVGRQSARAHTWCLQPVS